MALAAPFPAAAARKRTASHAFLPPRVTSPWRGVRLTRRGRAALIVGSALFLLAVTVLSGRFTADAGSQDTSGPAMSTVVVQSGENLWQIARRVDPGADPRAVVTRIREINALGDTTIVAGQSILVPRAA
jgi:nucleoid-associated protein YgaU